MKRATMLAAALCAAAGLTGSADAARFHGVIVAKDAKRQAVVTASRGTVRTVRTPSEFRRLHVGQRVAVNARPLSDGTFAAVAAVRGQGRVTRVRFRGVVVRHDRQSRRLILSAGSSVFAARLPARSTAAAAPDSGLAAGDKVAVTGDVGQGTLDADDVDEIGRASLLELEGIFLRATEDGFDMAVVHRGLVHVTVRDGALTPTFRAGDQIEVIVRVGEDGSFTFVKGRQDERDYGKLKDRHEYRAEGVLAGKSPLSVSVRAEKGTLTCAIPAGLDLALFRLGEKAKLVCVSRDGDLVMVRLRTQHGEVRGDGSGELGVHGVLTALSPADVSVRREDTTLTTCSLASPLDFSHFRIGERVKLRCRLEGERWRFASLHGEHASIDEHGTVELYVHGAFQGRSGTDVAVRRTDGSLFGCSAPAELDLSYFAANEQVKLHCRLAGGGRTLLMIRSERYTVGADGSVELYAHGTLSAKTETTVTVTASDGKAFTCTFPAGLDLSRFPVGTQVKVHCHLDDGALRLEHMRSETAAVEVKA